MKTFCRCWRRSIGRPTGIPPTGRLPSNRGLTSKTVGDASSGGEALVICEQVTEPIDLLLTDVVMPRMSGRELAERVSARRPGIKVLFMSGYTDDAVMRHGVLGAEMALVQKPLMPQPLLQKVREILDARSG